MRSMNAPYPMQIFQNDKYIALLFEVSTWFHVVPFRNEHPKEVDPTWFGNSIAKWDGDTLIVDTIGFNGYTRLDTIGRPHSDKLHLTQTFKHIDAGHVAYAVTVDDPVYYSQPWTNERNDDFQRPAAQYSCEENNKSLWEGRIVVIPPTSSQPRSTPSFPKARSRGGSHLARAKSRADPPCPTSRPPESSRTRHCEKAIPHEKPVARRHISCAPSRPSRNAVTWSAASLRGHFQAPSEGTGTLRARRHPPSKANCLRICEGGPIAVVYPRGAWAENVIHPHRRIIQEHLMADGRRGPVDRTTPARMVQSAKSVQSHLPTLNLTQLISPPSASR
jgi:(2Fe-2S) ferredoxin